MQTTQEQDFVIQYIKEVYGSTKGMIVHIMNKYPETRSNDTHLYLQCLLELGVTTIEEAKEVPLNIISVHKARQRIQNKEGKCLPPQSTQSIRTKLDKGVKQLWHNHK